MEDLVIMYSKDFWKDKKVFLTGHTGFKGSWMSLWLSELGANVTGYALEPPTEPSMFKVCAVSENINSIIADIRDYDRLKLEIEKSEPEIVIHMAAQPLVRESYNNPRDTYEINVMGTVNLLQAINECGGVKAVVNVTTDKCYENKEWQKGYKESDRLGGFDPYSNSKACSEMVTSSFRNSFFNKEKYDDHGVALGSARAGNVIGGGDWAVDRLITDCVRSVTEGKEILIRNPNAIRPWQHVLEPLRGYLMLAEALYEKGAEFAKGYNFGPIDEDAKEVTYIVAKFCTLWGDNASYSVDEGDHPHEATFLKLDCTMAKDELKWEPEINIDEALSTTVLWFKAYKAGRNMKEFSLEQIKSYMENE